MKIKSKELLEDLEKITTQNIDWAKQLKNTDSDALKSRPDTESWNALECIEHLNRYGDFYIPEFNKRITQARHAAKEWFKSRFLGNYFAKTMSVGKGSVKMKTFKSMDPINSDIGDTAVIDKFLNHQNELLKLLHEARSIDLEKTKTSITISSFIKLKIGDTFRVVIYHNERHLIQAMNAAGIN